MNHTLRKMGGENNVIYLMILLLAFFENVTRIYILSSLDIVSNIIDLITIPIYLIFALSIFIRKYNKNEIFFIGVMLVLLGYNYYCSGQAAFLKGFLVLIACKNLEYKKIIKSVKYGLIAVLALSIILYVTGVSYKVSPKDWTLTLGFGHPNVAAQVIMLCFLLHATEKFTNQSPTRYSLYIIGGIITFLLTRSKTSSTIIIIIPFVINFTKYLFEKSKLFKISKFAITYSCLLLFAFSYFSAKYLMSSDILIKLNSFFTGRIWLNWWLINNRDITLFGQNITMTATGIHNTLVDNWNVTITCDNSYITWLIRMGLVPSFIVIICNILLVKKAIKNKEYGIIAINLLLTVYAFDESHMVSIIMFFTYFYLNNGFGIKHYQQNPVKSKIQNLNVRQYVNGYIS